MSPADRPDPSPEPLPDDPDGSAPGPPEPEDLDVLVDRLAAEQARQSEAAPEQGPGSALLAEEMTTLLSILDVSARPWPARSTASTTVRPPGAWWHRPPPSPASSATWPTPNVSGSARWWAACPGRRPATAGSMSMTMTPNGGWNPVPP